MCYNYLIEQVFAPTNEAFSALSPELLAKLGSDPELLKKVLIFHVVPSRLQGAALQNEATPATLAGGKLRVNLYGPKSAPVNDNLISFYSFICLHSIAMYLTVHRC
jgi:uncharacterized surface protein with fasciclin (FAS1) repeats